ncbi:MAG: acyl-CoA thioesterase [Planctomycetota bacterium]|jgi:acyl-CoA thioester hydrolase
MDDRTKYNFSTEVRVRLSETDAFGIVFHAHFFTYFDVARMDYLRNLDALPHISPDHGNQNAIVHVEADFKSPARFDDVLVVHARISEIGRSSFTFEFLGMHRKENRVVATGRTVLVVLDPKTWKPKTVPDSFREIIRKFEGENLVEKKP